MCRSRWLAALLVLTGLPASGQKDDALPANLPIPVMQREEVRFITLDLTGEEKGRSGWAPLRGLRREHVTVLVGDEPVELEVFEDHCRQDETVAGRKPGRRGAETQPAAETGATPAAGAEPLKVIVYMDMSRISLGSWRVSLDVLRRWAEQAVQPDDLVMIAVARRSGVRVVRPFLPASEHLGEDIDAAMEAGGDSGFWTDWMEVRARHANEDRKFAGGLAGSGPLQALYEEEALHNQRALKNLRDAMALFDAVEGTKSLILFQDTLSRYAGQMSYLHQIAHRANRRNVRIYGVAAGGGKVSDAITYITGETGGRFVENTNEIGEVLQHVRQDAACFFRLGFRIRPRYDGSTREITVRVDTDRRQRLRYAHTLEDPTREELDYEMLLAAFLNPQAARAFPLSIQVVPLFHHPSTTRLRIQVQIPIEGLLSLPAAVEGRTLRQMRVQVGGSVLELPGPSGDPTKAGPELAGSERLEFARQSVVSFTDGDTHGTYLSLAEELDAPPESYRLILVAQDRLAGEVAARVAEFRVPEERGALGDVHVLVDDPLAIAFGRRARQRPGSERPDGLYTVPPSLPDRSRLQSPTTLNADRAVSLIYGLCDPDPDEDAGPFQGWKLNRVLECDGAPGEPVSLEGGKLPAAGREDRCTLMVNPLPAGSLQPGHCRFEATLERPESEIEVRTLEWQVVDEAMAAEDQGAPRP